MYERVVAVSEMQKSLQLAKTNLDHHNGSWYPSFYTFLYLMYSNRRGYAIDF